MRVYIGFDSREPKAYEVAESSLRRRASSPVEVTPLRSSQLVMQGLLRRPVDIRGGQHYDIISGAPVSTEFANSRFLVPLLSQSGWALFVDADVVFLDDVHKIMEQADASKAVQVVKHNHQPKASWKMVNQQQTAYGRKNWSSVMLINAGHRANRRLTLDIVNTWPGRELHAFAWLHDDEIGELTPDWNWLVGETPKPDRVSIAHFTAGGPFTEGWRGAEHDDIWLSEAA